MTATGNEVGGVVATDAGMFALWDCAHFSHIVDYDTWEPELLEDEAIVEQITRGSLVPVNIASDGAFQTVIRWGHDGVGLTDRESPLVVTLSEPYLLHTAGRAWFSGIEDIGADPRRGLAVDLPAGQWSIRIAIIDWDQEPGSLDAGGKPTPQALSDFVVMVSPPHGEQTFRTSVHTFPPPG